MKGALFWLASTSLAFAITAGVFLTLAEIGTSPPGQSLSAKGERRAQPQGPALSLDLRRGALDKLKEAKDQSLGMTFSNGSDRKLTDINVYLILSPKDTAYQNTRYYEAKIKSLAPNKSKRVHFDLDLSPPKRGSLRQGPRNQDAQKDASFNILEVRAASSGGVSTVKTAVLPF